jgi:hypothetical protein
MGIAIPPLGWTTSFLLLDNRWFFHEHSIPILFPCIK